MPSITELLFSLGLGACLVARTGFCVHPADGVRALPKVGGTKDVKLALLRALAPSHVIVNVDENRLDTVEALRQFVPYVVVTHPLGPEDNLALVAQMAAMARSFDVPVPGVAERAVALREALAVELAATRPADFAPADVLYLIWRAPWMTVARDTYISCMLARVGWRTLPALEGGPSGAARYPVVEPGAPWLAQVRQVLLSSEPYCFDESHIAEARRLCPNAEVQLVDGEAISWYGSRAIEGLRYLRRLRATADLRSLAA